MAIDPQLIGTRSAPQTFRVTQEAVQRFMQATEDPALLHGKPLVYAPPTFPTVFRIHLLPVLGIDSTRMQLLHGEQVYDYTRRLRIGEEVTCVLRIVDIRQREGRSGTMTFVTQELTGTDSGGQTIFTARSISIIRLK